MDGDKFQREDLSGAKKDDLTPLQAAASNGRLDAVQVLIGQGADINRANNNGKTPLYAASFNGQLDIVKFLIGQGADINREDKDGWTPVYAASFNGHLDVVKFLIDQGADINREDKDGWTPLYAASFNGHLDVVKFLFVEGANLNRGSNDGSTPLLAASFDGHLDVVQFLIGQGADLNRVGRDGSTPLEVASLKGHLDVVTFLIGQKADLNMAGIGGHTPLHAASSNGHRDVVQFLIGQGADLKKADKYGMPPLHRASLNGHLDVFLIGQGAVLNKVGRDGSTALEVASIKGHVDVVQFLIGQKADLNRAGKDGSTPLEAASFKGHLDVVQFLIGQGADLNRVGRDGSTPLLVKSLKDPAVGSKQESGGLKKQVDNEANVHTSKLEQLNIDSASSKQFVEVYDSMGESNQQSGLIRIEKYGIEVQFHPSEIWRVDDIQVVPEVPAELADLLTEDQAIICVGLKASSSVAKFEYPVKVTMPHSAIFTSPDTASIGTYHRKSSSDSFSLIAFADGDPRCVVRERDLDFYISHFCEWRIVAFFTKAFFGKRFTCTPFVPNPSPGNDEHLLRLCIRDSNYGKAEPEPGYVTPIKGEEYFVAWRSGDLTVTCQVDDREIHTKARIMHSCRILTTAKMLVITKFGPSFKGH
eukprot:XP_011680037.1 PREDICTED: ankyrin repeat domain-containing protein 50-like [Strongylocentrotus purpuratus]